MVSHIEFQGNTPRPLTSRIICSTLSTILLKFPVIVINAESVRCSLKVRSPRRANHDKSAASPKLWTRLGSFSCLTPLTVKCPFGSKQTKWISVAVRYIVLWLVEMFHAYILSQSESKARGQLETNISTNDESLARIFLCPGRQLKLCVTIGWLATHVVIGQRNHNRLL